MEVETVSWTGILVLHRMSTVLDALRPPAGDYPEDFTDISDDDDLSLPVRDRWQCAGLATLGA